MKLRDVFRFAERILGPNHWDLLDERYNSQRKDSKKETTKIVSEWITKAYKHITEEPDLSLYIEKDKDGKEIKNPIIDAIRNPVEEYDKLMKFMVAYMQGKTSTPEEGIVVDYSLKGTSLTLTIILNDDLVVPDGKTNPKEKQTPNVNILIPTRLFNAFVLSIKTGGMRCYGIVEEFVTTLYKPIYHEMSHILQYLTGTEDESDVYDLKYFDHSPWTSRIEFVMYMLESDEMRALFNEAYVEYKKKGKYQENVPTQRRTKKKNFVDTLFCLILWRTSNGKLATEYSRGEKRMLDVLNAVAPDIELLIIYLIFVYGLNESGLDTLVKRDDKNSMSKHYDLNLVEANITRLKGAVAKFHKMDNLQMNFVDYLNDMDQKDRTAFFTSLFSTKKSNEAYIEQMKKWSLDSVLNNKASSIPLIEQ